MAFNWFNTTGQPADTVGSDGDWARDSSAKIDYGPKGSATAGSWAQTARSVVGASGLPVLSTTGTPGSGYGQNGQIAFDPATGYTYLKSNNAWTQAGQIVGATGPQGTSNLGALTAAYGPSSQIVSQSLTSTPVSLSGSQYQPVAASAFIAAQFNTSASTAVTFVLYDITAGSPVYSYTLAAATQNVTPVFPVATYPMVTTHQYEWRASTTTSQTAAVQVTPIYAMPSSTPNQAISLVTSVGYSTATNITTTAASLPVFGTTYKPYYVPVRTGGISYIQATMTAQGGTATSSTAQLYGYYQLTSGGAATAFSWSGVSMTADGVSRVIVSQNDSSSFNTGYQFYFQVKSSATISVTLQVNVLGLI